LLGCGRGKVGKSGDTRGFQRRHRPAAQAANQAQVIAAAAIQLIL
jgi:hypothetical protein